MDTLSLIYYSPTGTTQRIVKELAQNVELKLTSEHNITKIQTEFKPEICDNSLTIIALPVYGGRIPISAIETLKKFQSNQSPAVIIVVYGNRAYEDSMLELNEIVSECGFRVIAGAAFIGEHSFSSVGKPIAHGRPDKQDLIKCYDFSRMINYKLKLIQNGDEIPEIRIPGNYPYKERKQLPATIHPETNHDLCTNCGKCVEVCPTNAISINQTVITNGELCTWCFACIKNCPTEARIFDNPAIEATKEKLFANCSVRQEPEYFI